jgi:hypothetical protein
MSPSLGFSIGCIGYENLIEKYLGDIENLENLLPPCSN